MRQEQEPKQQFPIKRWAALSSKEEAEREYILVLDRHGRLFLETTSTDPRRPISMDEINKGAVASQKYLDELTVFLEHIPQPFREHLEKVDGVGASRMQRIQTEELSRRREAKHQEKTGRSKGERLYTRRVKAQRRQGTKPRDIH